ncbi:MAG: hypothetical protein MJE66_16395 [Proteobacteria bacterium]|nr:hypothetical protein [Pseudomonadota bacterium]
MPEDSYTETPPGPELADAASPWTRRVVLLAVALGFIALASWQDLQRQALLDAPLVFDPGKRVVLLSTTWCGYCAMARRYLHKNGVAFVEYDVENSAEGQRAYAEHAEYGVPIFLVDDRVIYGFDLAALIEALAPASDPG